MTKKTLAAVALLAASGLTLTACGDDTSGDSDGQAQSSDTATSFNDADVTFAQQMIPHHQQAVEMAQMADGRATSAEVKELAENIEAAQGPEIETMTNWLEEWGQEVPSGDMEHGDMGHGGGDMAGMMDDEQMSDLEDAMGGSWDQMFLEMMIEHHEGAIEMAETEVDEGESPEAVALAEKIITDQQAEIALMQDLLDA
ncbi:hypothetical protein HIDPHFAB_03170 [Nocardioides sp. T2.26MG-1]|nr:DUF305 domain-containing protein [Nocardioides sp. T2.26MG-1]CAI9418038.1 hypothetical protein HIDPHFAB_03170 [Nocardioides sp. T2.26MG-1]